MWRIIISEESQGTRLGSIRILIKNHLISKVSDLFMLLESITHNASNIKISWWMQQLSGSTQMSNPLLEFDALSQCLCTLRKEQYLFSVLVDGSLVQSEVHWSPAQCMQTLTQCILTFNIYSALSSRWPTLKVAESQPLTDHGISS